VSQRPIEGVRVKPLRVIPDERGRLMEILRRDDDLFLEFGQVYLTTVYPGVTKAWHYHEHQHDHFACVVGAIKLALFDEREGSPTRGTVNEHFLGVHAPILVQIPPRVWHGFKNVGDAEAVVVNVTTRPYDRANPDEHRIDPHENHIPYRWARKDG
jgi:dTDP-4-dehydrorhamnose 3,5-epimerase